jgi:hypothetical protein
LKAFLVSSYFRNDTGPHGSHGSRHENPHKSKEAVVGGLAHVFAEPQVRAEFLDGFGPIDIDAQDDKHFFDCKVGGFLACVVGAVAELFLHFLSID